MILRQSVERAIYQGGRIRSATPIGCKLCPSLVRESCGLPVGGSGDRQDNGPKQEAYCATYVALHARAYRGLTRSAEASPHSTSYRDPSGRCDKERELESILTTTSSEGLDMIRRTNYLILVALLTFVEWASGCVGTAGTGSESFHTVSEETQPSSSQSSPLSGTATATSGTATPHPQKDCR